MREFLKEKFRERLWPCRLARLVIRTNSHTICLSGAYEKPRVQDCNAIKGRTNCQNLCCVWYHWKYVYLNVTSVQQMYLTYWSILSATPIRRNFLKWVYFYKTFFSIWFTQKLFWSIADVSSKAEQPDLTETIQKHLHNVFL